MCRVTNKSTTRIKLPLLRITMLTWREAGTAFVHLRLCVMIILYSFVYKAFDATLSRFVYLAHIICIRTETGLWGPIRKCKNKNPARCLIVFLAHFHLSYNATAVYK